MANVRTWLLPLLFLAVFVTPGLSREPDENDSLGELEAAVEYEDPAFDGNIDNEEWSKIRNISGKLEESENITTCEDKTALLELARDMLSEKIKNAFNNITKVVQDQFDSISSMLQTPAMRLKRAVSNIENVESDNLDIARETKQDYKNDKDDSASEFNTLDEFVIIRDEPDIESNNVEIYWQGTEPESQELDDFLENSILNKMDSSERNNKANIYESTRTTPIWQYFYYNVDSPHATTENNMKESAVEVTTVEPLLLEKLMSATFSDQSITNNGERNLSTEKGKDTARNEQLVTSQTVQVPMVNDHQIQQQNTKTQQYPQVYKQTLYPQEYTQTQNYPQLYTQTTQYPQDYQTYYPQNTQIQHPLENTMTTPTYMMVQSDQQSPEPSVFVQEMTDSVDSEVVEKNGEKVTHISHSARYRLEQTATPHYSVPEYYYTML